MACLTKPETSIRLKEGVLKAWPIKEGEQPTTLFSFLKRKQSAQSDTAIARDKIFEIDDIIVIPMHGSILLDRKNLNNAYKVMESIEDPSLNYYYFSTNWIARDPIGIVLNCNGKSYGVYLGSTFCYSKKTKSIFLIRGDQVG